MDLNISLPGETPTGDNPITGTVSFASGENTNLVASAQNCWQQYYQPYPSMPNNYYVNYGSTANVTYLHLTEEQLREIVREEVSKAIEGLGSRVRRRAGVRKAE